MADYLDNNNNDLLGLNPHNNSYNSNYNNSYNNNYNNDYSTQDKYAPGSYEYAYSHALNAMNCQLSPEETAALLMDEGYTEDQAITVVRQILDADENDTNAGNDNTNENKQRINEAMEIAREALLINQLSIAQTHAILLKQGYTDDEANAVINKVSVNANAGAQQFILENPELVQTSRSSGLTGGASFACGVILLIAGIIVSVVSKDIIWTGGIGVGIILIVKGFATR